MSSFQFVFLARILSVSGMGIGVYAGMSDPKQDPKPTQTDVQNTPPEEQNVDRDGRERMPNEQTDNKY
jgi:hypothetical protein